MTNESKKDISNLDDIKILVNSFYDKVKKEDILAPIFNEVIQDNWPKHLEKMYAFWETILLDKHTYFGSPFPPHAKLVVDKSHFEKWATLFHQTIDENFEGLKAEEAKIRAVKMAEMFQLKRSHYQNNEHIKPIY